VYQRQITAAAQDAAYSELSMEMQANSISPAEMARFREKVKPVIEQFSKAMDPALVKAMYESVEAVRSSN